MRQVPPRSVSNRLPNTDGESHCGRHSQSTALVGAISASTRPLPIAP